MKITPEGCTAAKLAIERLTIADESLRLRVYDLVAEAYEAGRRVGHREATA
jgi:hypothetical protein